MPPALLDLGIQVTPAHIHKIRHTFWNSVEDFEQRANNAVARIFNDPEHLYSFWRVESEMDFYCIAASLNAGRSSPSEEIGFIWVTATELQSFNLTPQQSEEGKCLYARKLHYDVLISSTEAYEFCLNLMRKQREACRCKKKQMQSIVDHLTEKGCQVYCDPNTECICLVAQT